MAECQNVSSLKYPRKLLLKRGRKVSRNISRKNRRRNSKLRYYKHLKTSRSRRKTDDLCAAIVDFNIADMSWAPNCTVQGVPSIEVAEWHKFEQIAYWKARALSLEYENRMLHEHLRNVYAKQVDDYATYAKDHQESPTDTEPVRNEEENLAARPPQEPVGRRRREEMKKLYGITAEKIMGMETAVQLNYELHLDSEKPQFWPQLPLRLTFD